MAGGMGILAEYVAFVNYVCGFSCVLLCGMVIKTDLPGFGDLTVFRFGIYGNLQTMDEIRFPIWIPASLQASSLTYGYDHPRGGRRSGGWYGGFSAFGAWC